MIRKKIENLNTKFLGKRIDYYECIDSTHIFAKQMNDTDIENGMIIIAENQLAGIRNTWQKMDFWKKFFFTYF